MTAGDAARGPAGSSWRPTGVYGAALCGLLIDAVVVPFKAMDAGHSLADALFGGAASVAFLCAGVFAHRWRPQTRVGVLMVLVGLGSVAEDIRFVPWPPAYTLGLLLSAASTGFAVHLLLAFPTGRLATAPQRWLVAGAYALSFVEAPVGTLFLDPRSYGQVYPPNLALVRASTTALTALSYVRSVAGVLLGIGVVAVLARRWVTASAPQRRILLPVLLTGLVGAVASLAGVVVGETDLTHAVLLPIYRIAFCLLPLGFLIGVLRFRLGGNALAGLLIDLQRPLGAAQLEHRLATVLGDASLRVGYWRDEPGGLVTADGEPMPVGSGQVITYVERDGRRVAGLMHDAAVVERAHVLRAAAAAAGLMLDNQRLAAEVRAHLGEIRASRARIVAAGAQERRRMERDLHDGVQQSLVAAAIGIRMIEQRLAQDPAARDLARAAGDGLDTALSELRDLARGLHPAVLSQAGLVAALESLVERTPVPVRLRAAVPARVPLLIEETAYLVVAEALTNAMKHAGATIIDITAETAAETTAEFTAAITAGRLRVEVTDDGIGGADPRGSGLLGLADRVRAVDGELTVRSEPGHGTCVSALLPWQDR